MTRTHVPVLAGELIEILDPQPGETAVDCTFGAGGHARLVAERIGASGTLVCIDRDPVASERFEEFAAEVQCTTRFLSMEFSEGLRLLREEGLQADLAYLDLGVSSMQIDAWADLPPRRPPAIPLLERLRADTTASFGPSGRKKWADVLQSGPEWGTVSTP